MLLARRTPAHILAVSMAAAFGAWFARAQLLHLGADFRDAPWILPAWTGGRITIAALLWYLLLRAVLASLSEKNRDAAAAAALLPLLLPWAGVEISCALALCLAAALFACLEAAWRGRRKFLNRSTAEHVLAFAALFSAQYALNALFSPSTGDWRVFSQMGKYSIELPLMAPVYSSYRWIRMFSLSDLDYAHFAAVPHVPTAYYSPGLQFLTLLFNSPSVDLMGFYRPFIDLLWLLCAAGSFGCYLYLRLGLKLRAGLAVGAALIFPIALAPFWREMVFGDYFINLSALALFPYALLCGTLALQRASMGFALASGAMLALPFAVLASHPEAQFYALSSFALVFGIEWLATGLSLKRKLGIALAAIAAYAALSAMYTLPMLAIIAEGQMALFGHHEAVRAPWRYEMFPGSEAWLEAAVWASLALLLLMIFRRRVSGAALGLIAMCFLWLPKTSLAFYGLRMLRVPMHIDASHRHAMFAAFAVLCIAALAAQMALDLLPASRRAWPGLIVEILAVMAGYLFASQVSPDANYYAGNPDFCPYYFTLEATLADFRGLSADRENDSYLRARLLKFERDARGIPQAFAPYAAALNALRVKSAAAVPQDQLYAFARKVTPAVDGFYLNPHYHCVHPSLDPKHPPRHILPYKFNLTALYRNLDSPFRRIAMLMADSSASYQEPDERGDLQLGLGRGLFIHNSSTSYDARFIVGPPLLHTLYLMPGYDFRAMGDYKTNMNWERASAAFLVPQNRHLYDIAGVDIFTVPPEKKQAFLEEGGFRPLEAADARPFTFTPLSHYSTLVNEHSYGMAYLASSILARDPGAAREDEREIREVFKGKLPLARLEAIRARYLKALDALNQPREAYLETREPPPVSNMPAGSAEIRAIAGEATIIEADCRRAQCALVYNMAYLPGWRMFVDGKPEKKERANFAFLSVRVPEGKHEVWAIYLPLAQMLGTFITLGGWGWLLALWRRRALA